MRLVKVGGIKLEVHDVGTGDPVVLVQTALTADELAPLAEHLVSRGACRAIVYHRRGYARSSPVQGPGSVIRDAADCRDLIVALGLSEVHIVGYSYSGAVGLQLADDAAEQVHTLALIEPPPVHVPSAAEFRAANARLQEVRRPGPGHGAGRILTLVIGPEWRTEVEQRLPGAAEQMQRDTTTSSTPTCQLCCPGASRMRTHGASAARCCISAAATVAPGSPRSGTWCSPDCRRPKTSCSRGRSLLGLTHVPQIADALADFLGRHPIHAGGGLN